MKILKFRQLWILVCVVLFGQVRPLVCRFDALGGKTTFMEYLGENCQKFVTLMESENWEYLYAHDTDWYAKFVTNVKNRFNECFPPVRTSRKRFKDKPWLTHSLKTCIQKKHKFYKTHLRNISENATRKYKVYRNVLTKCLKKADEMYYKQLIDDTQQSAYNLWKHLGPIINPNKKKRGSNINKILYNGEFIKDKRKICIAMITHVCEVGKKLQEEMPDCGRQFKNYLPEPINSTLFLRPIAEEELMIEINRLNPRKACGPDKHRGRTYSIMPEDLRK